jgi:hypothetical protein
MGFTKKQRRDQKKQHVASITYKRRRKVPPTTKNERPASSQPQKFTMVLVKTSWTDGEGGTHEDFQLLERAAEKDAETLRQELLHQLLGQGREHCQVEFFDPDNVPPGTIPAHARISPAGA